VSVSVKYHHELLHKYNMRKDATQILIGKASQLNEYGRAKQLVDAAAGLQIATVERATVAEISLKLGLDPTD
jgi:hypothetical protein